MKDYRLYIVMRNDLPSMGAGRAAAQASHAANAFIHEFGPGSKCYRQEVKEWQRQTPQGFGTAIVLSANKAEIEKLFTEEPLKDWIIKGKVFDPDYVIQVNTEVAGLMKQSWTAQKCNYTFDEPKNGMVAIHRNELTCAYVFGEATDAELLPLKAFPLYS